MLHNSLELPHTLQAQDDAHTDGVPGSPHGQHVHCREACNEDPTGTWNRRKATRMRADRGGPWNTSVSITFMEHTPFLPAGSLVTRDTSRSRSFRGTASFFTAIGQEEEGALLKERCGRACPWNKNYCHSPDGARPKRAAARQAVMDVTMICRQVKQRQVAGQPLC